MLRLFGISEIFLEIYFENFIIISDYKIRFDY